MEFEYRLTGTGWAEARIGDDSSHAILTASYLSDALGDLLATIGLLLEGASEARCSWQKEPGEYRWIFVRTGDEVHLNILAFDDMYARTATSSGIVEWGPQPDDRGELRFSATQPLPVFARAIADGAAAALREYGEDGYRAKWLEDPFPIATLALIRDQLSTSP